MRYYILFMCVFSSLNIFAIVREFPVKLSLNTMFDSHTSYATGIKGSVNSGGKIDIKLIDKNTGTLLFQCILNKTSAEFAGNGQSYAKESLGSGATYYPASWNSLDLKTALFAIDRKHYDQQTSHIIWDQKGSGFFSRKPPEAGFFCTKKEITCNQIKDWNVICKNNTVYPPNR